MTLSPIVWLDYFALAVVPLALARPRLSLVWFLPLATWGLRGAGLGIGDPTEIARLLLVFVIVFGVAFHGEPDRGGAPAAESARDVSSALGRVVEDASAAPQAEVRALASASTPADLRTGSSLDFLYAFLQAEPVVEGSRY